MWTQLVTEYYWGYQIVKNDVGRTCSMYGRDEKFTQFCVENLN
jgi:hypothetical protein